jgi:hypothetical protein
MSENVVKSCLLDCAISKIEQIVYKYCAEEQLRTWFAMQDYQSGIHKLKQLNWSSISFVIQRSKLHQSTGDSVMQTSLSNDCYIILLLGSVELDARAHHQNKTLHAPLVISLESNLVTESMCNFAPHSVWLELKQYDIELANKEVELLHASRLSLYEQARQQFHLQIGFASSTHSAAHQQQQHQLAQYSSHDSDSQQQSSSSSTRIDIASSPSSAPRRTMAPTLQQVERLLRSDDASDVPPIDAIDQSLLSLQKCEAQYDIVTRQCWPWLDQANDDDDEKQNYNQRLNGNSNSHQHEHEQEPADIELQQHHHQQHRPSAGSVSEQSNVSLLRFNSISENEFGDETSQQQNTSLR